jgi:hypothetical protein
MNNFCPIREYAIIILITTHQFDSIHSIENQADHMIQILYWTCFFAATTVLITLVTSEFYTLASKRSAVLYKFHLKADKFQ